MIILERLAGIIDSINERVGQLVSWVSFVLVIVVLIDVIMRYMFNSSYVFVQELEWHMFAFLFLLSAGYTLLYDQHVRVDLFYQQFSPKTKALINLLGVIFFLLPGCYLIIWVSIPWVITAYEIGEISPDPGGIPARFIVKAFVPIGFVLLMLQGVSLGINSLKILLSPSCS
ncbi:MAG: TRAP transporter small permease subunit [Magnetococcales bacterium]|nr:TRAP transporter small permease subunit [Magnetococcales bacterium]